MYRALERARSSGTDVKVYLVVDGPMPPEIADVATDLSVQVVRMRGGSSRRSMLNLYRLASDVLSPDEIAWFAEDDYVYTTGAFVELVRAARGTDAEYFVLHYPDDFEWHRGHQSQPLSKRLLPLTVATVDGEEPAGSSWMRVTHSTSTFGGRSDTVTRDLWLLRLATLAGSPFAHSSCMAVQGRAPFRWGKLAADANFSSGVRRGAMSALRGPMRTLVNFAALWQGLHRSRTMIGPVDDLICHAETGFVTDSHDWSSIAASSLWTVQGSN